MIACEGVRPLLSAFADDEVSADERQQVRTHLSDCHDCRGLVQDLTRLRTTARGLGSIAPPDYVWLEVAGGMTRDAPSGQSGSDQGSRRAVAQWIGLTAALVLITLAVYSAPGLGVPATPDPPVEAETPVAGSVDSIAEEMRLALEHYENAISELETLVESDTDVMDPELAAAIRQNVDLIDRAIAESRTALVDDPTSQPVRDSLFEALRRKVAVLQSTVQLINEMRQGDEQGAAETAAGLGTKS